MKIFPKLTLAFAGLILSGAGAVLLTMDWGAQREIRLEAGEEQQRVVKDLAHIAWQSLLTSDDLLLVKYVRWLPEVHPAIVSAGVFQQSGRIIAHSDVSRMFHNTAEAESPPSYVVTVTQPVRFQHRTVETATISFSQQKLEEEVQSRLSRLRRHSAGIVMADIGAGILVAFILALSWSRPIRLLAQKADDIGQGNLKQDIATLEKRSDELGFLSRRLARMARSLQELEQKKEDFVAAVTHELRSPLSALDTYLRFMAEQRTDGDGTIEKWHGYHERMQVNTERLDRFVSNLLEVSALERGKVQLHLEAVDLEILVKEVFILFETQFAERRLTFDFRPPSNLPKAHADGEKIRQVLVNFVSNAIKFTPDGGRITVGIEALEREHRLRISISDTGLGISEEDQEKLFNKFEQVQSARRQVKGPKGTGLGLYISRALVEMHGGMVGLKSRYGQGSTFSFTLSMMGGVVDNVLGKGSLL